MVAMTGQGNVDAVIGQLDGCTQQVGCLIGMMNYARSVTLSSVRGLSREQLDVLLDSGSNPIGALLSHIAAIEYIYSINTFEAGELTYEEKREWGAATRLGQEARDAIRGNELGHYVGRFQRLFPRNGAPAFFSTMN